jgi:hypothetical protein
MRNHIPYLLGTRGERNEFKGKKKLLSLVKNEEKFKDYILIRGFRCEWLEKDGKKKSFVMQKRIQKLWRRS